MGQVAAPAVLQRRESKDKPTLSSPRTAFIHEKCCLLKQPRPGKSVESLQKYLCMHLSLHAAAHAAISLFSAPGEDKDEKTHLHRSSP